MTAKVATPHGRHAPHRTVSFGLLTISDTRTEADDRSGATMRDLVTAARHAVYAAMILPDEPEQVREQVLAWVADARCDVVVSSGGTGLSARDRTIEALAGLFEMRLEGFGELFRVLSFQEVGSAAMLSRAAAGIVRGTPVFALPGSPAAVSLALSRLVLPEIGHMIDELRRGS